MQASNKRENIPHPRASANPFSVISYWWMLGIFRKGFNKDLESDDLYGTLEEHKSRFLGDKMERLWKEEVENSCKSNKQPNLFKVIIKCFGLRVMSNCIIVIINDLCFLMTQPFYLGGLIRYFTPGNNMDISMGCLCAAGIIVSSTINVFVKQSYLMSMMHVGMKIRIGLCSLFYRKALKLSKTALEASTVGQMVTLLANDMGHFDRSLFFFVYLWFAPIQIIIISYCVWLEIGVAAVIGIIIIVLVLPFQAYMGRMLSILRTRIAKRTDERIRLMNEIISAIQVIKMYAWEKQFANLISIARKHEVKIIRLKSYIHGSLYSCEKFAARIAVFVGVMAYVLFGNSITAEKMFVVTANYDILKRTMTIFFPEAVIYGSAGFASVQRIKTFLLYEEIAHVDDVSGKAANMLKNEAESCESQHLMDEEDDKQVVLRNSSGESDSNEKKKCIIIHDIIAKWNEELPEDTLTKLRLDVKQREFVAVIGPVGAGKTSLFHVILKELPLRSGSISVGGSISYASQEPWLFTGTVQQNILFGQPMDRARYKKIVSVCALERDFELLPHGDKTIVGDRGMTLSGGQRARINLARAVYREADIYLLDDPLSAVDAYVGQHLFEHCICDFLKDKTRILATHQLQYIQIADSIVILENGAMIGKGTFAELQNSDLDFAKQLHSERVDSDNKADRSNSLPKHTCMLRNSSVMSLQSSAAGAEISQVAEMRSHGSVNFNVYRGYFAAGGNWFLILLVFGISVLAQIIISGGDYWMSYWTKVEEKRSYWTSVGDQLNRTEVRLNSWLPDTETCIYIYTGITVATVILALGSTTTLFRMCMKASINLHNAMFKNIIQSTMWFFSNIPAGQIFNRFSKDIGDVDELLPGILLQTTQQLLAMFGIFCVVVIVNAWLLIPTAFVFVIFYMLRVFYIHTSRSIKRLEGVARSPVFSYLNASLQGLTTIRAFGTQSLLQEEFDNIQDMHSSSIYLLASSNRAFGLWLDLTCIGYITVIILIFLTLNREQFAGDVGLVITQAMGLTGLLQWVMRLSTDMEILMTSVERVQEFTKVDREPPFESTLDKRPPKEWPSFGKIVFDKVILRYSVDEKPVLDNISITINSAEKVGIVGRTGAGKSSLITALFRLVDLSNGSIKIDGIDISTIGLHDLRSKISIIPQEPALFSGSLRENLDPFDQYSDAVLWSALEEVELKQVVEELPAGLSHKVSEGGSNFSVGQRQLLCLARAIIRKNKILVMDEATANVDPQTDEFIQATIRHKFSNCTVLTVAHRLHTVMDSDRIIVMDAGKVVEFSHPHLLLENKMSTLYRMVQQTGLAMEEILCKIAQINYERKFGVLFNPD